MVDEKLRKLVSKAGWSAPEVGRRIGYGNLHGPERFMTGTGSLSIRSAENLAKALGHQIVVIKSSVTSVAPDTREVRETPMAEGVNDEQGRDRGG